jgi:NAD(P)-dependent dehydrogenase (short-subunit alcohol dehydrogenase family)
LSVNSSNVVIGLARNKTTVDSKLAGDKISNVYIFQADLVDSKSLYNASAEVSKLLGVKGLDYLVVNGAYVSTATASFTPTDFVGKEDLLKDDLTMSFLTNVLGPIYTINTFLPLIRKGETKKIFVTSTGMADPAFAEIAGVSTAVPYTSSKAAVNTVVTKYAIELNKEGIMVLALSPGLVNTAETLRKQDPFSFYAPLPTGASVC